MLKDRQFNPWFGRGYCIYRHEYYCRFNFIILFICTLLLYTINLDVISLFANSSFMFIQDVEW